VEDLLGPIVAVDLIYGTAQDLHDGVLLAHLEMRKVYQLEEGMRRYCSKLYTSDYILILC